MRMAPTAVGETTSPDPSCDAKFVSGVVCWWGLRAQDVPCTSWPNGDAGEVGIACGIVNAAHTCSRLRGRSVGETGHARRRGRYRRHGSRARNGDGDARDWHGLEVLVGYFDPTRREVEGSPLQILKHRLKPGNLDPCHAFHQVSCHLLHILLHIQLYCAYDTRVVLLGRCQLPGQCVEPLRDERRDALGRGRRGPHRLHQRMRGPGALKETLA